jgi:hypothetical protein
MASFACRQTRGPATELGRVNHLASTRSYIVNAPKAAIMRGSFCATTQTGGIHSL